jgi:two-component system KDP operon response regulator KdpE
MTERTYLLIIEDDPNIVDLLRANLLARGFVVDVARDGQAGLAACERERPDLVLLDLNLPRIDGFEVCRRCHASGVPVIVLSARADEPDKVRALYLGADDYLTKPFGIDELMARIHATLRRSRPPTSGAGVVRVGDVEIDMAGQSVHRNGRRLHLTPTEFALLATLAARPGELVTHAALLRQVWGPGYATKTEYVRVYVRRLRAKLEDTDGPPLISTEPRLGYRLEMPSPDAFTER